MRISLRQKWSISYIRCRNKVKVRMKISTWSPSKRSKGRLYELLLMWPVQFSKIYINVVVLGMSFLLDCANNVRKVFKLVLHKKDAMFVYICPRANYQDTLTCIGISASIPLTRTLRIGYTFSPSPFRNVKNLNWIKLISWLGGPTPLQ